MKSDKVCFFLMLKFLSLHVITSSASPNNTTTVNNPFVVSQERRFCQLLKCEESGLTCCRRIFRRRRLPTLYCCNENIQHIPTIAILSSIAALIILILSYLIVKRIRLRKQQQARKAAELAARNPPPFNIALTMELNSKPVQPPPSYNDVTNTNVTSA